MCTNKQYHTGTMPYPFVAVRFHIRTFVNRRTFFQLQAVLILSGYHFYITIIAMNSPGMRDVLFLSVATDKNSARVNACQFRALKHYLCPN